MVSGNVDRFYRPKHNTEITSSELLQLVQCCKAMICYKRCKHGLPPTLIYCYLHRRKIKYDGAELRRVPVTGSFHVTIMASLVCSLTVEGVVSSRHWVMMYGFRYILSKWRCALKLICDEVLYFGENWYIAKIYCKYVNKTIQEKEWINRKITNDKI